MIVLMFQERFAHLVEQGAKRQTIRPVRKREIHPGDSLSLRRWMGKPYRSKQRLLRKATCGSVNRFKLDFFDVMQIGSRRLSVREQNWLAHEDGFSDVDEMRQWFSETHGLPFCGILIQWYYD